jgi:hypothetical protein
MDRGRRGPPVLRTPHRGSHPGAGRPLTRLVGVPRPGEISRRRDRPCLRWRGDRARGQVAAGDAGGGVGTGRRGRRSSGAERPRRRRTRPVAACRAGRATPTVADGHGSTAATNFWHHIVDHGDRPVRPTETLRRQGLGRTRATRCVRRAPGFPGRAVRVPSKLPADPHPLLVEMQEGMARREADRWRRYGRAYVQDWIPDVPRQKTGRMLRIWQAILDEAAFAATGSGSVVNAARTWRSKPARTSSPSPAVAPSTGCGFGCDPNRDPTSTAPRGRATSSGRPAPSCHWSGSSVWCSTGWSR